MDVQIEARTWTVGTLAHMTTFAVDTGLGCVPCMGAWALGPKDEDVRSVAEQRAVTLEEEGMSCTAQSCCHAVQKRPC